MTSDLFPLKQQTNTDKPTLSYFGLGVRGDSRTHSGAVAGSPLRLKSDNLHLPLCCHHRFARTMLMKEYRICMPLTVEEVGEVFLAFVVF
ncbi:cytoplasmic phosphatidylinositol transfer protein 1 isoform X1 [Lates japonicus]|uniref:Cytoplasmic phosphatidylinositol transfer protein 1 isoform X1 n=1 Tax=Lates japonicus TaxID=270547 RepID=A0AAD3N743_LATJO|nr:cytoplasmic phosphatidylinositol transfer protein 1 isoform X1 [Lates japonicus]